MLTNFWMLFYFYWKLLHFFGLKFKTEPNAGHVQTIELFMTKGNAAKNSILDVSRGPFSTSNISYCIFWKPR